MKWAKALDEGLRGLALAERAGNAVVGPMGEFRIVFRMGIHGGDQEMTGGDGLAVARGDTGEDELGAGDIERAGGEDEVELGIDIQIKHAHG